MGMSCFLVQEWMRIIKVLCFSVHFCSQLSPISCFVCIVCIFCRYLCDSMLVRCSLWQQFLSRVDILMQFSDVFWEPFMGMSCFYGVCWQVCDVLMQFYRVCWKPFMGMSYFLVQNYTHVTKVSCFSVHLPFVLAPWGFARLCEAFGGIGSLWDGLEGFGRLCRLWGVLWGYAQFWEAWKSFGRLWEVL